MARNSSHATSVWFVGAPRNSLWIIVKKSSNVWEWAACLCQNSPKEIHHSVSLPVSLATNLAITWAIVEFGTWSSRVHHKYMSKKFSCHLEGGASSIVNNALNM